MDFPYLAEYFLFTLLAAFAVFQITYFKKSKARAFMGMLILVASYTWFFTYRDRNVPSVVEGSQLFFIFGLAAFLGIYLNKIVDLLVKNESPKNR